MGYVDHDLAEDDPTLVERAGLYAPLSALATSPVTRQAVVLVVEDGLFLSRQLSMICDFLDIGVERVPSSADLLRVLGEQTPMAVVCELDGIGQDGFHVMKTVATHDRTLPILILTGRDPAMAGAADAIEEIWRLTEVTRHPALPGLAPLVDFLFHAGRRGGCLRLLST